MRFLFRPLPGFTALFVPMLAILLALGLWQIQRLHWKTALIAQMNENMHGAVLSIGDVLRMGPEAAEYRRVALDGRYRNNEESYVYGLDRHGAPVLHVYTPLDLSQGGTILVDRGIVPMNLRSPSTRAVGELDGVRHVIGIVRLPSAPGLFTPAADLAHRTWFARDVSGIARADHLKLVAPIMVEADATPNPGGWPQGGQTRVDLPNDHLQYAVTWFLMAAGLVVVYFAYHRSHGRIGIFPSPPPRERGG